MDLDTFIIAVSCFNDDRIKDRRILRRGPASKVSDSEVLIVGAYLGLVPAKESARRVGPSEA